MFCAKCGADNAPSARFCGECGAAIDRSARAAQSGRVDPSFNSATGGASVNRLPSSRSADDDDADLYAEAIGNKNRDYYVERFQAFDAGGSSLGWHWPAFFITFYWLLYRKMWGSAALYIVGSYIVSLLIGLVTGLAGVPPLGTGLIAMAVLFVVPALYANRLYHAKCKKLIARAYEQGPDVRVQRSWLANKGGTSAVAVVLIGIFAMVSSVGILAAIALPAYQDYTVRARVAGAYAYGQAVTSPITERYALTGKLPNNREIANIVEAFPPPDVRHVEVKPDTSAIQLTVAKSRAGEDTFELVPYVDNQQRLQWKCQSVNLPQKHLPIACRERP